MDDLIKFADAFKALFIDDLKESIIHEINKNLKAQQYPLVLDVDEASEYSGIAKTRLRELANYEKDFPTLPREKGEKMFFSRDGLAEWVRRHEGKEAAS